MAQVASRLRAMGAAAALLVAVSFLTPAPARAAGDVVELPGATSAAVRVDLDANGVLDLARLAETQGDPPVLEVWLEDETRDWARAASVEVPWPENGDVDAPNASLGTALLGARIDGVPNLLLITTLVDPGSSVTCCLTVHVVRLDGSRLRLASHPVAGASAHDVMVLDFDGDGNDELVAIAMEDAFDPAEPPTSTLRVFGWADTTLELLAEYGRSGFPMGSVVGDTDGLRGAELITALDDEVRLERLAWDGAGLSVSEARAPSSPNGPGWPAGVIDGHLVFVDGDGISALAWPSGGGVTRARHVATPEFPNAFVVGTGEASLLVSEGGSNPFGHRDEITVYDESLKPLGTAGVPEAVGDARSLLAEFPWEGAAVPYLGLWGFSGPMPGSGRDVAGWVSPAGVVRPDGPDGWRLDAMAPILGTPVGALGTDDAWVAICEACWNSETHAFIAPSGTFADSALVLTRADAIGRPDRTELEARYEGAVVQAREPTITTLLARSSGGVIELPIPAGSHVISSLGRATTDHGLVDGRLRLDIPGVGASGRRDSAGVTVVVIAPDTSFRVHRWQATYASESGPAVTAVAQASAWEFESTITGTADPMARVSVNGDPVAVDDAGRFSHTMWASPIPQTVTVTAADPFGTERTVRMEVVGFIDPRGLPWVPIVGSAIVAFGAVLFLRVPRGARRSGQDGDGTLEELDGDVVA